MAALKLDGQLLLFRLSDNKAGHKEQLHSYIALLLGVLKVWACANQVSKDAAHVRSRFE